MKPVRPTEVSQRLQLPLRACPLLPKQSPVVFYDPDVLRHGQSSGGTDNSSRLAALIQAIEQRAVASTGWKIQLQQCFPLASVTELERVHCGKYLAGLERISALCEERDNCVWPSPLTEAQIDQLLQCLQVHSCSWMLMSCHVAELFTTGS